MFLSFGMFTSAACYTPHSTSGRFLLLNHGFCVVVTEQPSPVRYGVELAVAAGDYSGLHRSVDLLHLLRLLADDI